MIEVESTRSTGAEVSCRALSVEATGKRYGVGRTTIYKHIRRGSIRVVKIGRRTLIIVEDAECWIASLRTAQA